MSLLDDLAEVSPKTPVSRLPPEQPVEVMALADIDAATATARPRTMPFGDVPKSMRPVRSGDVVLARIAPSMQEGKLAIVPAMEHDVAYASGELLVLRPRPDVPAEWLRAFLRQERVRERLALRMTGSTGRQRLAPRMLRALELPAPPPPSELASFLATQEAIDALDGVRAEALRMLAALPVALVEEAAAWCRRRTLVSYEPAFDYGISVRGSASTTGPVVLRAANLRHGELDLEELQRLRADVSASSRRLEHGDVLVVRTSGSRERLGEAAVYEGSPDPALFASQLIRIRLASEQLHPELLCAWMQTAEARRHIVRDPQTTGGQYGLGPRRLKSLPVPEVSQEEQDRVVAAIRAVRELRQIGRRQLLLLRRLRQAHLAGAFAVGGDVAPERLLAPGEDDALAAIFDRLNAQQQRLWQVVTSNPERFTLDDLLEPGDDRDRARRGLRLLERLGVVISEREQEAVSFRRYDPELDAVEDDPAVGAVGA